MLSQLVFCTGISVMSHTSQPIAAASPSPSWMQTWITVCYDFVIKVRFKQFSPHRRDYVSFQMIWTGIGDPWSRHLIVTVVLINVSKLYDLCRVVEQCLNMNTKLLKLVCRGQCHCFGLFLNMLLVRMFANNSTYVIMKVNYFYWIFKNSKTCC